MVLNGMGAGGSITLGHGLADYSHESYASQAHQRASHAHTARTALARAPEHTCRRTHCAGHHLHALEHIGTFSRSCSAGSTSTFLCRLRRVRAALRIGSRTSACTARISATVRAHQPQRERAMAPALPNGSGTTPPTANTPKSNKHADNWWAGA